MTKHKFDHEILLLQGGGALGAYHAGVLINQHLPYVSQTKDYEFSRATVDEHWASGLEDVRGAVTHPGWLSPEMLAPGLRVHNLTE